jgi:hypothetical protein
MPKTIFVILAALLTVSPLAQAQKPPASGATVVSSEPGKAVIASTVEATATVIAIDKATRTVTLQGPQHTFDIVAGDEVRNFDQIRIGDNVTAKYVEALSLELKKTTAPLDAKGTAAITRAAPGARPGGAAGREITFVADVVDVDQAKSTISLKGPSGNVVDLKVQNPDQFKVVKKGDQVEAVYTQALAVSVMPAKGADRK